MTHLLHSKLEVLKHLEKNIQNAVATHLKPVEEIWHPSDLLPDASNENFYDEITQLQQCAKGLSYDLLAV